MTMTADQDARFAAQTAELIEAFCWFRDMLREAFAYEADAPHTLENERERLAAGLVIVANFVAIFDLKIAGKFGELGSALGDLADGVVRPLLTRHLVDRRPGDPSDVWRARARLALALHALMRNGVLQEDGAASIQARSGKAPNTVIGWRKDLMAGRAKNAEALLLFKLGCSFIERISAERRKEFAERMISEAVC